MRRILLTAVVALGLAVTTVPRAVADEPLPPLPADAAGGVGTVAVASLSTTSKISSTETRLTETEVFFADFDGEGWVEATQYVSTCKGKRCRLQTIREAWQTVDADDYEVTPTDQVSIDAVLDVDIYEDWEYVGHTRKRLKLDVFANTVPSFAGAGQFSDFGPCWAWLGGAGAVEQGADAQGSFFGNQGWSDGTNAVYTVAGGDAFAEACTSPV